MTTPTTRRPVPARPTSSASARKTFAIVTGIAVLFIFVQSITAGTFIEDGLPESAKNTWTDVHGFIAYPVMVFSLLAAIVAFRGLRGSGAVPLMAGLLFVATVVQWLSGHAISTLGMDWVTPFHVALAFVVYGIAIWLSIASARLRREAV